MLKLKLQYSGHLMQRVDPLEKTLMLGGIGGRRKRAQQMMFPLAPSLKDPLPYLCFLCVVFPDTR